MVEIVSEVVPTSARLQLSGDLPQAGDLVVVRTRRWLVEEVLPGETPSSAPVVRLACADDDAQGQILDVFWTHEPDRALVQDEGWADLASRGFDSPQLFGSFFRTLRWGCVTATDPSIFQSPFRAGIKIDAYQMEPLRKALRLPRVSLFIADDTGLGKTIEAGLIARELLLRKKAKSIVVSAPSSVLEQWKAELEERFGLVFEILDRAYLNRVRQDRGFGVNPWRTHSRFLISHSLLIDPLYTDPMREWLGSLLSGSLLILDEAHHAAPSSGGRYGIESKFTRAVRDLCGRFEHRLFLSATPHNGHSNSFSTLLELLDPYRFTRGVKVRKAALDEVMVRRLKEDIRKIQGGFPERKVVPMVIQDLPLSAPELRLSTLLNEYRELRERRFSGASKRARASAGLLLIGLQQRLLSSIEAFARSLKVHRDTAQRHWDRDALDTVSSATSEPDLDLLSSTPGADDERAEWSDSDLESRESAVVAAATAAAESGGSRTAESEAIWTQEQALLDQMQRIADLARHEPDAKVLALVDWIRLSMCPDLAPFGQRQPTPPPTWTDRRVIVFTENRDGTKRYLRSILEQAIDGSDRADERIEFIDGLTSSKRRRDIQGRFNRDPSEEPLRILIATDAAREGLNFQAHCTDLFHFDLPWNPGRIEQRNGRIDRKQQPADEVRCHYFSLPQRAEDHVLRVLVRKTERIKRELGSLSKVIDEDIERRLLKSGIRHSEVDELVRDIEAADIDAQRKQTAAEELEAQRDQREKLKAQIEHCQTLLEKSRAWVGFEAGPFRNALSCSLELLGSPPLKETRDEHGREAWSFPPLDRRAETDASWAATLDTLRKPREPGQKLAEWRRDAPIRPVVFEDVGVITEKVVHLHLEQRVVQRLLARFRTQGFVYNDLSRACLTQVRDSIPRVLLLGRLSLYGTAAERLHEEIVPIAARWIEPSRRNGPLSAYATEAESKTIQLLEHALLPENGLQPSTTVENRLLESAQRDIEELLPQLEPRAGEIAQRAINQLRARGETEAKSLRETLDQQRKRVLAELAKSDKDFGQMSLGFNEDERRQLESDVKAWRLRLDQFDHDLRTEPDRIREFYEVKAQRVEPVGLVYLWPETN